MSSRGKRVKGGRASKRSSKSRRKSSTGGDDDNVEKEDLVAGTSQQMSMQAWPELQR